MTDAVGSAQEESDRFYWRNGPCCAGCDWWRRFNSVAGECTRSAPAPARERWAMLGISGSSLNAGAGHVVTQREHLCGEFRDAFDWSALPAHYLRRIGFDTAPVPPRA